jgi:hypothetical protein
MIRFRDNSAGICGLFCENLREIQLKGRRIKFGMNHINWFFKDFEHVGGTLYSVNIF